MTLTNTPVDYKSEPGSTYAQSTSPDVSNEKQSAENIASDHESNQKKSLKKPNLDSDCAEIDESEYPTGARLGAVVAALVLAIFLVSLNLTIVAPAIPKIRDKFHGLEKVSWYSSAFFMCMGAFQSAWGKGYKYFPRKNLSTAIFVFELGSLICGTSPNSRSLIVGRAIAGVGVGAAGIGSG